MSLAALYNVVLALCCLYAACFGGRTGISGAILFVSASKLTAMAGWFPVSNFTVSSNILIIDASLLFALFLLASKSNRYWPIWALGLQLITVLTHLSAWLAPAVLTKIHHALVSFWSLPILFIMVAGTALDRQYDLKTKREAHFT